MPTAKNRPWRESAAKLFTMGKRKRTSTRSFQDHHCNLLSSMKYGYHNPAPAKYAGDLTRHNTNFDYRSLVCLTSTALGHLHNHRAVNEWGDTADEKCFYGRHHFILLLLCGVTNIGISILLSMINTKLEKSEHNPLAVCPKTIPRQAIEPRLDHDRLRWLWLREAALVSI
jgi:hypothetical protein